VRACVCVISDCLTGALIGKMLNQSAAGDYFSLSPSSSSSSSASSASASSASSASSSSSSSFSSSSTSTEGDVSAWPEDLTEDQNVSGGNGTTMMQAEQTSVVDGSIEEEEAAAAAEEEEYVPSPHVRQKEHVQQQQQQGECLHPSLGILLHLTLSHLFLSLSWVLDAEKRVRKKKQQEMAAKSREPRKINKLTVTVKDLIQSGVIGAGHDVLKIDYSVRPSFHPPRSCQMLPLTCFLSCSLHPGSGICRLAHRGGDSSIPTP